MNRIKKVDALREMRKLSDLNMPFSFSYYTYSDTNTTNSVLKQVTRALLRAGLSKNQSDKHNVLIAYKDYSGKGEKNRQFYYPLLMSFNGLKVIP